MKIRVKNEGRPGIFIPVKEDLIGYIFENKFQSIHHAFVGNGIIIGADWSSDYVIALISSAERIALLSGDACKNNMGHSLAVIKNNELNILDIGEITDIIEVE